MHFSEDFIQAGGVIADSILNGLLVQQNGTPNKSVNVLKGVCYIPNSSYAQADGLNTRFWRATNTATVNVVIADNASGNPRIDIICAKLDTGVTPDADASNVATIVVVQGTPGAVPAVPATPSNHIKLADVAVANGFSTIVTANITDKRPIGKLTFANDGWNELPTGFTRSSNTVINAPTGFDPRTVLNIGDVVRYLDGSSATTYEHAFISNLSATQITLRGSNTLGNDPVSLAFSKTLNAVGYDQHRDLSPQGNKVNKIKILRQDNTTDSYVGAQIMLAGWGFIQGTGAAQRIGKVVTLGLTFTTAPIILTGLLAHATSSPTAITDFTGALGSVVGNASLYARSPAVGSFTAEIIISAAAAGWSTSVYIGYAWLAIGEFTTN